MDFDQFKKPTRLLYLPEPHRTILEASIDAMLKSDGEASIEIKKVIVDENHMTFSIRLKSK